jgi:hypothetical protein
MARMCEMNTSIRNKKIVTVMFGFLFIGGVAAILGSIARRRIQGVHAATEYEEPDGEIFVYGAYA